jgi:hypothetical protein
MKTSQLLGDIYSYYENGNNYDAKGDDTDTTRYSDTAERRGHLYDLQRYASAYEAAALYYVATTTYQTNQRSAHEDTEKDSRQSKGQKQSKKGKDEALNLENENFPEINENEEEQLYFKGRKHVRGLQLDDLMDASNDYTYLEIMQVLPRVKTLAEKLKGIENSLTHSQETKAKSRTTKAPCHSIQCESGGLIKNLEDKGLANMMESKNFNLSSTISFSKWRDGVLLDAKLKARKDVLLNDISDEMAIAASASAILDKYSICPHALISFE